MHTTTWQWLGTYLVAVKLLINAPAFIKTRASEPPASIRDRRLFETRRLIEVLRHYINYKTEKYATHDISVNELNIYICRTSESLVSIHISQYVHLLEEQCSLFAICRSDSMVYNKVDLSLPLRHFRFVITPCATVRRTRVWLRELGAHARCPERGRRVVLMAG